MAADTKTSGAVMTVIGILIVTSVVTVANLSGTVGTLVGLFGLALAAYGLMQIFK